MDDIKNKFNDNEDKSKVLKKSLDSIKKRFGEGTRFFSNEDESCNTESISTGSFLLDDMTGIGGVPRGRFTEIYGLEGSGKTTIALSIIAQAQKNGEFCAFIDMEHALNVPYAKQLGVQAEKLIFSQPDNGEQALDIAEELVRSGAVSVIVVDSVAALVPKAEIEGQMGDATMGAQARLMSQGLRKLTSIVSQHKTVFIFINQIRSRIGVLYGNPETTTGGYSLKFYASLRMEIKKELS